MFLIAGIQPRTRKLEGTARRCPACGQFQAYRRRIDHYLSLFFIPLLKVKTGEPFILCDSCSHAGSIADNKYASGKASPQARCLACGRSLKQEFSFCPYCGAAC
ncbi:MAG: hypothetical protein AMJ54_13635 [Deltaproteobacteria bacterium SG8_13]|nr:MAG: hypothetical protein AMJ54_13635 [Deltaproteobacteria bacterium SG8_13]